MICQDNRDRSTLGKGCLVLVFLLAQASVAIGATDGFLPNSGQLDAQVQFYGGGDLVDVFFTNNGVVFDVKDAASIEQLHAALRAADGELPLPTRKGQALHLTFPDSRADVELVASDENVSRYNYFFGSDSRTWKSGQASYRTLTYRNLWDGVDLVFSLDHGELSYQLVGESPAAQLKWSGASQVLPTASGTTLETIYGALVDNGARIARRGDPSEAAAAERPLAALDAGALLWSTLIGGSSADEGHALAIAANGDILVAGETSSPNFPGTPGAYEDTYANFIDIFVSRFSAQGNALVWSSFLGTSDLDYVNALTMDNTDSPVIVGRSHSSNYPTTVGAYDRTNAGSGDGIVSKLSGDGSTLVFSTFIGGSAVDSFFDVEPNAAGNLVCAGYTASTNYPVTAGAYQTAFAGLPYDYVVSVLSADGSALVASTYIGGTDRDACRGVAVDANGDLFLAGFTFSADFPVTAGVFQTVKSSIDDAALLKMTGDLTTVVWSTFLGGNNSERALAVALDSQNNPVIAGFTLSSTFPTTVGALQPVYRLGTDGFVAKFASADGTRDWSTYLGGSSLDEIVAVAVDASDNPVVTGWTESANFPVNSQGYDATHNGTEDIFASVLAADGADLLWGSFLGGSGNDRGLALTLDAADNPVVAGGTTSANFPVSAWAYDQTPNGGNDAVLARFDVGHAELTMVPSDASIGCGTSTIATYTYNPDAPHSPPLRGYSVRIQAPAGLTFGSADITVFSPLVGVNDTFQVLQNGPDDFTIDFSFLDPGLGLETAAALFSIEFSGSTEGQSVLAIYSGQFRDLDNHPFDVDTQSTVAIDVDCTAPGVASLTPMPAFTAGTSNVAAWSDESASGATAYNVQVSAQSDFAVIVAESGFLAGLSHEFTGLLNGVIYYYRVFCRDDADQISNPSPTVFSRQDAAAPVSSVAALPLEVGADFDIPFSALDAGSGVAAVEIFYNFQGGAFSSAGSFTASPGHFTSGNGDGTYGFYAVSTDSVGNREVKTAVAEVSTFVNTSGPDVPTLAAEPLFTAGAANTVFSSDESASGAVAYNFQMSQLPDFSVVAAESGPLAVRQHEFVALSDNATYYYRVAAIDSLANVSDFSAALTSTQDASAPISAVTPLGNQNTTGFAVAFSASDAGIGVEVVELFASFDGGPFVSAGSSGASPIAFTALQGEGPYAFATMARDSLGNSEAMPEVAQAGCVVDLTSPTSSVAALAPFQVSGVFAVTASGSDNLTGIASYELFYSLDGGPWVSAGVSPDGNFSFAAPADGAYEFYSLAVDGAGNVEDAPAVADATTSVDTNGPIGTLAVNAGAVATNNVAVTLSLVVVGAVEMRFSNDNLTFSEGWVPFSASHAWLLDGVEGANTVHGEFHDIAGNLLQVSDSILFDSQPAGPVTFLALGHGHQTVTLDWHNPDDTDLDHVEIWRGLLHDGSHLTVYPDYTGGTVPTGPADRAAAVNSAEWVLAGTIGGGAEAFIDTVATRGVYYYEVFTVDAAGNFSAPNGQLPATTNYILGDMAAAFDGVVGVIDLTVLGATYGLIDGAGGFNKHADVGPTNNYSSTGIPQPDDMVNFEDLMITAGNYNLTSGASSIPAIFDPDGVPVALGWFRSSNESYTLRLLSPDSELKGLNIRAALPAGVSAVVTMGDLCLSQVQPAFLQNIPAHGLDAGCCLLGAGQGFVGTGDLLKVTLPAGADLDALALGNLVLDLRDIDNHVLEFTFETVVPVDIPASFSLGKNFPNPFNPTTSISFSLPTQENVRLEVYGLGGRRVAVLVDESLAAGHHEVTWSGQDEAGHQVASGVYFYRIRAGQYTDVQKMTLVK